MYGNLKESLHSLLSGETDFISNAANFSSLVYNSMQDVNWVGFYILKGKALQLGPFMGKPACVRIDEGKGVCGAAAKNRKTLIVDNVHEFPGHIACDAKSNSELVVPLIKEGVLYGVLDIDSPSLKRFNDMLRSCNTRESKSQIH